VHKAGKATNKQKVRKTAPANGATTAAKPAAAAPAAAPAPH
jgi:hypothetical protein